MNYEMQQTPLSRYTLTGVLAGVLAVLVNFILDFWLRGATGYSLSGIVNVSTIIFGSLIPATIGGLAYNMLHRLKGGDVIYITTFILLTALFAYLGSQIHRSDDRTTNMEFHELLIGMIVITGLFTSIVIPFFAKKPKYLDDII